MILRTLITLKILSILRREHQHTLIYTARVKNCTYNSNFKCYYERPLTFFIDDCLIIHLHNIRKIKFTKLCCEPAKTQMGNGFRSRTCSGDYASTRTAECDSKTNTRPQGYASAAN